MIKSPIWCGTNIQCDSPTLQRNQAVWRSRRGLLELDLYLTPFVEACFSGLSNSLKTRYGELLECEDVEILDWVKGTSRPPEEFVEVIEYIVEYANRSVDKE